VLAGEEDVTGTPGGVEVVTLGECMVSFVAVERGPLAVTGRHMRTTIAGAEANVAVGLARLGHRAAFIGRVGDDGLGTMIVRGLRGEGVECRHLRSDPGAPTGVMIRELRDIGPAEVIYWRSGSAGSRLAPSDVAEAGPFFAAARWLHLTGITPALSADSEGAVETALELARANGLRVSLDVNLRRRLWTEAEARPVLAPLAARCDVVLGSLDEIAVLGGLVPSLEAGLSCDPDAAADSVLALGATRIVVKLGAGGALERRGAGREARSERAVGLAVSHVLDPVGAGDAFTAGYIAACLEGLGPPEALRMANACGAAATVGMGDQTGLLTRRELARVLGGAGRDVLR
jgi:2-dehydro-3-deoxygluconokinase